MKTLRYKASQVLVGAGMLLAAPGIAVGLAIGCVLGAPGLLLIWEAGRIARGCPPEFLDAEYRRGGV